MSNEEETTLRRGPWTLEEDNLLIHYIACHGEGRWNSLAQCAGLKRTGKSCRLRWLNYLKPDIKRGNLSLQEQLLILELHSKWGNRWSKIAQHLPGRTDNEIKNYWRTRVQKQARQLNIESDSKRFLDAVRGFWMPRSIQKVEQTADISMNASSSTPSMNSQSPIIDPSLCSPSPPFINCSNTVCDNSCTSITNLSYSYSNSMKISELQGVFEDQISPNTAQEHANFFHTNPFSSGDCYYADASGGYRLDDINMANMSASGIAFPDCQVADSQWTEDDIAGDTMSWNNTDELWQFR